MQGIIGEGYGRMLSGEGQEPDDFKFHGRDADYLMQAYFSAGHAHDVFGAAAAPGMSRKRRLVERVQVAFPLAFSSTGSGPHGSGDGTVTATTTHRPRRALIETVAPALEATRRPFFRKALTPRGLPLLGFTQ